jgi:hypothetical protein
LFEVRYIHKLWLSFLEQEFLLDEKIMHNQCCYALVIAAPPLYRGVALIIAAPPLYRGVALVMSPCPCIGVLCL